MKNISKLIIASVFTFTIASPALADLAKGTTAFKAQDYAAAKIEFDALPNDMFALYYLGLIHMNGMGVERDPKLGRKFVKKSADMGNIGSQLSMARAYQLGIGLEKDLVLAHYYYSLAGRNSNYNQEKAEELAQDMTKEQLKKSAEMFATPK